MKRVLLFTSILLLISSCGVKIPYRQYSGIIDFTEFTNEGFFVTESNSVSFDYNPIGSVTAIVESGYEILGLDESQKEEMRDDIYAYHEFGKLKFGDYIYASIDAAMSEIVSRAKEFGANGIINLEITYIPSDHDKYGNVTSHSSCTVTGMAIKHL